MGDLSHSQSHFPNLPRRLYELAAVCQMSFTNENVNLRQTLLINSKVFDDQSQFFQLIWRD